MVEDIKRFEKLSKMLDKKIEEQISALEQEYKEGMSVYEKELLNNMEKAIEADDLFTAYRYQAILKLL